eukprot:g8408.t1
MHRLRNIVPRRLLSSSLPRKPLANINVIEMEGLAIAPFVGKLLLDYGANVVRIDRKGGTPHYGTTALEHGKTVIQLNLKDEGDQTYFKKLIKNKCDILIDPYRPNKMEKLNLGPKHLMKINDRLIYTSLTGYGHDGPMSNAAGHDINYLSMSGALSMFSRCNVNNTTKDIHIPFPPVNFLGDFAGAGLTGSFGILLALYERELMGKGQIVNVSVIDGVNYMTTFFHNLKAKKLWSDPGTNAIDGGAFYYDVYETLNKNEFISVGAIEPQFYNELIKCMGLNMDELPDQNDVSQWPKMKMLFTDVFKTKTRDEWVYICDGKDSCLTPVLTLDEIKLHQNSIESDMFVDIPCSVGSNDRGGQSIKVPKPPVQLIKY